MLNGASPQEAKAIELQTYARESGGTVEAVVGSGGKTGRGSFAYDSDDGFWLSNGSERALIGYGASMNDVSSFLGNSAARDLGMQYASNRLVARQQADEAFYQGQVTGIHQVRQATAQRNANFTGFRGDLMTQEDWGRTISAHTQKWAQQDASKLVELGSYMIGGGALVAGGVKLMAAGALQIAKSGFRGAFIHGSSNTAAAMGVVQGGARLTAGYHAADIGFNIATNPGGTADLVRAAGQTIYTESVRNGGFTYASGFTFEGDVGGKLNVAIGPFVSMDFNSREFNYGIYFSSERGAKLGMPNPTATIGWEHSIYPTSDHAAALSGKYTIHGGGDNYRDTGRAITAAYIRTGDNYQLPGYQFTVEVFNRSLDLGIKRDPNVYSNVGDGILIYDSKSGKWVWEND